MGMNRMAAGFVALMPSVARCAWIRHHARGTAALVIALEIGLPSAVAAQTLADGSVIADVGAPTIPGYATLTNGAYLVSGSGWDIGGKADQFTFVYRQLTGDGTIIARVASLQQANAYSKAG